MSVDYRAMAAQAAARAGIPPQLFLGLVKQESGFNPNAHNPSGASGLTQLMPGTARGLGVTNPYNPAQNLAAGAAYLARQYKQFGRWDLALAAYNAGPGNVQKYHGIPPFAETQNYVKSIMGGLPNQNLPLPRGNALPVQTMPLPAGGQMPVSFGDPARAAFVTQMVQAIGMSGQARENATMAAILGLRRGLSAQTSQMANMAQMRQVMMGAPAQGGVPRSAPQGSATGMNSDFQARLLGLEKAVSQAGGKLSVRSGFRSVDEQRKLWDAAVKKYGSAQAARAWVAPPGNSMHNKGLAADLAGNLDIAHKLASKFGLVFPLSNEAWHIEPIGARG